MFGVTPQDEMLFKNNLKEQKELLDKAKAKVDKTKAEYLESKKVLDDMLEGQAAITFADNLRDKAAELRASSGQGLSVLPNALATAYEVFADILDAASDIKEAIRQWKETKEYKALSEQDAKAADQAIADEFGEIETTESIFSQVDDAINKTGVEATTARRAMKEKFGIDNYQKAIKITREFDKITDRLDAEGKITKKCP
jgi:PHP family Zn ribbon phosphoesterase